MGVAAAGQNLGIHSFRPPPFFRDLAIIEARYILEKRAGGQGAIKFGQNNKKCLLALDTQGAFSLGKQQSNICYFVGKNDKHNKEKIFPLTI